MTSTRPQQPHQPAPAVADPRVEQWLQDCCLVYDPADPFTNPDMTTPLSGLRDSWRAWCADHGQPPQDEQWLSRQLSACGFQGRTVRGRRVRVGLVLLPRTARSGVVDRSPPVSGATGAVGPPRDTPGQAGPAGTAPGPVAGHGK